MWDCHRALVVQASTRLTTSGTVDLTAPPEGGLQALELALELGLGLGLELALALELGLGLGLEESHQLRLGHLLEAEV